MHYPCRGGRTGSVRAFCVAGAVWPCSGPHSPSWPGAPRRPGIRERGRWRLRRERATGLQRLDGLLAAAAVRDGGRRRAARPYRRPLVQRRAERPVERAAQLQLVDVRLDRAGDGAAQHPLVPDRGLLDRLVRSDPRRQQLRGGSEPHRRLRRLRHRLRQALRPRRDLLAVAPELPPAPGSELRNLERGELDGLLAPAGPGARAVRRPLHGRPRGDQDGRLRRRRRGRRARARQQRRRRRDPVPPAHVRPPPRPQGPHRRRRASTPTRRTSRTPRCASRASARRSTSSTGRRCRSRSPRWAGRPRPSPTPSVAPTSPPWPTTCRARIATSTVSSPTRG